ncbi:S26 family signal peptidase [Streptomyces canarius]
MVKRVIGVGGDRVACCTGTGTAARVTVNGKPIEEPYLKGGEAGGFGIPAYDVRVPEGGCSCWVTTGGTPLIRGLSRRPGRQFRRVRDPRARERQLRRARPHRYGDHARGGAGAGRGRAGDRRPGRTAARARSGSGRPELAPAA